MKINQRNLIKYTITYKNKVASQNYTAFQELMSVLAWTTQLSTHILSNSQRRLQSKYRCT